MSEGKCVNDCSSSKWDFSKQNSWSLSQPNYRKLRLTLLNRRILGIKAEFFCNLELQKGKYTYREFQTTFIILLLRIETKKRMKNLEEGFLFIKTFKTKRLLWKKNKLKNIWKVDNDCYFLSINLYLSPSIFNHIFVKKRPSGKNMLSSFSKKKKEIPVIELSSDE